jgi:TolA-binding protein
MPDDAAALSEAEIEQRVTELRDRMRPLEQQLAELRGAREQLQTELRRRQRLAAAGARKDLKAAMRGGSFPTVGELVANSTAGSFDDFVFNLATGGEVRLGFPLARTQSIAFTDGKQVGQAKDLAEAARYYAAGWDFGAPGKPGVRVHLAGTRTERLVEPGDVFVRPR